MPPSSAARHIIGYDPSLASTGWAALTVEADGSVSAKWGVFTTSGTDIDARLRKLFRCAAELADEYDTEDADDDEGFEVAMETPYVGANPQVGIKLGQAQAALALGTCWNGERSITRYAPATIKKVVTGDGRADKKRVRATVARLLGLDAAPASLDSSDALAAAYTLYIQSGPASVW